MGPFDSRKKRQESNTAWTGEEKIFDPEELEEAAKDAKLNRFGHRQKRIKA